MGEGGSADVECHTGGGGGIVGGDLQITPLVDTVPEKLVDTGETQGHEQGLDDRENKGRERYEEHKEAIEELRQALVVLTEDSIERKKLEQAIASSLMALSHDKLVTLGKSYQRRGAITLAELNNLKLIYTPYHDGLGGNSDGEGYYTYCCHLPIVTEEEAIEMDNTNRKEQFRQLTKDGNS